MGVVDISFFCKSRCSFFVIKTFFLIFVPKQILLNDEYIKNSTGSLLFVCGYP